MNTADRVFTTSSAVELEALAARVAGGLAAGDRVALFGDLGAGKTTFVRGLARGLFFGEPRDVVSPTFAIHHRYDGGRLVLDHVDLYRLTPPVRLEKEGLEVVASDRSTVLCCEWPERLQEPLPWALAVHIDFALPDRRRVTLRAPEDVAPRLFAAL